MSDLHLFSFLVLLFFYFCLVSVSCEFEVPYLELLINPKVGSISKGIGVCGRLGLRFESPPPASETGVLFDSCEGGVLDGSKPNRSGYTK